MENVDSLISARWVIPVEPSGAVLRDHALAVRAGTIVDLLPAADAERRYAAAERVRLEEHALIPGLVNLHTHAAMTLMRGLADDLPLMEWLKDHVWPAEAKHVSHEFVHDGTLLACAEMLRGGVTCFSEMYFFPGAAAQAVLEARMRAVIGIIAIELPTAYASDADDYIAKGLATRDAFRDEKRLGFSMAPHAPYTVADRTFSRMLTIAEELDLPIHVHLHETHDEIEHSLAQFAKRPLERLHALGLVGPRLIAVHGVHFTREEIALLARYGASVAHCPSSNLKLASGFAPVAAIMDAGINVGLGTDGAASNNRLDMFQEMRTAALLAKAVANRADAMPAHRALAAATLNGARALGLDRSIGSLTRGKRADLCAVSFADVALSPVYDPISHLVYAAGREHVTHVWCEGELLVEDGRLIRWSRPDLLRRAHSWRDRLAPDQKA
jgi:5-methylthioadenosine/S-adenosylhomocysteine deaminase